MDVFINLKILTRHLNAQIICILNNCYQMSRFMHFKQIVLGTKYNIIIISLEGIIILLTIIKLHTATDFSMVCRT